LDEDRSIDVLSRFSAAVAQVASGLSLPTILRHLIEAATALADARYGALGVLREDRTGLAEFVTAGIDEETVRRIGHPPEGHGVLGLLIRDPRPLRLRDLMTHPASFGFPPNHPRMHSFLGVPIRVGDEVFGNLYLCDKRGADEFSGEDEALIESLAAVAAVAVENARLHERLQDLAVLRDRERIARDLHDKVIQRLFAAGMALQAATHMAPPELLGRVHRTVDELDEIVNEIRATIFDLELRPADRPTLAAAALATVDEMTRHADLQVSVQLTNDVDRRVSPEIADTTVTALREALANTVRHAGARHVTVTLGCEGPDLVLQVVDDGHGLDHDGAASARPGHGKGLANLAARARDWGGSCTFASRPEGGTTIEWRVPCEVGTFAPPTAPGDEARS
jgi:signal transduction histidine kinase